MNDWQQEIVDMKRALEIWEWYRAGDRRKLARHVLWIDATAEVLGGWRYRSHPEALGLSAEAAALAARGERPESRYIEPVENLFDTEDVLMPAYFLVQRWINEKLHANASPHLLYDVKHSKRA